MFHFTIITEMNEHAMNLSYVVSIYALFHFRLKTCFISGLYNHFKYFSENPDFFWVIGSGPGWFQIETETEARGC